MKNHQNKNENQKPPYEKVHLPSTESNTSRHQTSIWSLRKCRRERKKLKNLTTKPSNQMTQTQVQETEQAREKDWKIFQTSIIFLRLLREQARRGGVRLRVQEKNTKRRKRERDVPETCSIWLRSSAHELILYKEVKNFVERERISEAIGVQHFDAVSGPTYADPAPDPPFSGPRNPRSSPPYFPFSDMFYRNIRVHVFCFDTPLHRWQWYGFFRYWKRIRN